VTRLGRCAENDGIDHDFTGQEVSERREVRRSGQLGLPVHDGGELKALISDDRW
jgi:hypothetical protein